MNKVAIQGTNGSFHDIAAKQWFGNDVSVIECDDFSQTFEQLSLGLANYAVVAIENSLYGSIHEVYDLLLTYKFPIIGELPQTINQCLIGLPGTDFSNIQQVHSHPVALAQCSEFLNSYLPKAKKLENKDTAASVLLVKNQQAISDVAIASPLAAKIHGLEILKNNIGNHQANYTRFLVLSKGNQAVDGADKISLVAQTNHQPGALYKLLGVFAENNINLTKLQSRPIPGKVWQYRFYIDIETTHDEYNSFLEKITNQGIDIVNLGYYKRAANGYHWSG